MPLAQAVSVSRRLEGAAFSHFAGTGGARSALLGEIWK